MSTPVRVWSKEHLLRMVQQHDWPSPVLATKDERTHVQRKMQDGKAQIEKKYLGKLERYQIHENGFIEHLSHIPALQAHIAYLSGVKRSATMQERYLYTEWRGLDILQWQTLLAEKNPLTNSVPGVLYLLRCILQTCHPFHAMGYVHNDLHFGNLIVEYQYDWFSHSITLLPQQMRVIDFEFACYPRADHPRAQKENFPPRPASWSDLIDPGLHSPHVCPYEVEQALTEDEDRRAYRRYRRAADGNYIDQEQGLEKIDFGVDFFTLGQALEGLLLQVENQWEDEETLRWFEAESYLRSLPQILRKWDETVPAEIRPVPHLEMMAEIDAYLGDWASRCNWQVRLPGGRQWRFGKRAWWGGGLVLTAAAAAVGGLLQETTAPPKPEPPYEFAVRRDTKGNAFDLAADDSLTVVWKSKEYKGRIGADGRFYFQLPPAARGQSADIMFRTKGKYEVAQQSLKLASEAMDLPLRAPTREVLVNLTHEHSTTAVVAAKVWIEAAGANATIFGQEREPGSYILHVPLTLPLVRIQACTADASGFLNLALGQGNEAISRDMQLKPDNQPSPGCAKK